MIIFLRLLLGHLVGDFALQTGKIARSKQRCWRGLLLHTGVVTLSMICFAAGAFRGWLTWVLAVGLAHLLIDSVRTFLAPRLNPRHGLLYLVFDQGAHILTLLGAVIWGAGVPWSQLWRLPDDSLSLIEVQLIALSCLVLLVWVAPVIEMEVLRSLSTNRDAGARLRIHPVDRIVGAVERLLLFNLLVNGWIMLAPCVLAPRFYLYRMLGDVRREPLLAVALIRIGTSATFVVALMAFIRQL